VVIEFIVAFGGAYLLARAMEKRQIRLSAQKLREDLDSAFSSGHEFVSVVAQDFHPDLDIEYYSRKQAEFEQEGFQWVDDIEDLTLTRQFPPNRTFQRLMVTPDGKMRANIYHLRPRGKLYRFLSILSLVPKEYYTLELATEFSGGFTLMTNNTQGFPTLDMPPQFDILRLEPDTPTSELVHVHRCRIERFVQQYPEEPFHEATKREDLLNAIERILILCQRFRNEQGYSMDELERIGTKLGSKSAIKDLHKELNKDLES
jgi:hypothetical protein